MPNTSNPIAKPIMRQIFLIVCILILAVMTFTSMIPYISGLIGACILYVLTMGLMRKLTARKFPRWLSATLLLLFTAIVVIMPIGLIIFLLTGKITDVVSNLEKYIFLYESNLAKLENYLGVDIMQDVDTNRLTTMVTDMVQALAGSLANLSIALAIMYFILYFMLINFDRLKETMRAYVPLSNKNFERVNREYIEMVRSNAIAIPLVALMQGIVALLGFWIFGAPNPWFWFAVTAVGSMIPFVGTAIGMLPVVIILYAAGNNWEAIGLAIYGLVIVGSTDNVFRIVLQRSLAEVHPLITLIGVIIGIPLFGFLGLVFGPLIISLLLLLIRIYKEEYASDT